MIAPAHLERRIGGERLPGLVDPAVAGKDQAGEDQRLPARPALDQAAVDEELVGAGFQARASSTTPTELRRSAASTVATSASASSPAVSYCLSGLS